MEKVKYLLMSGAVASASCIVNPATAATIVDGACISASDPSGCLFNGNINSSSNGGNSFLNAQNAYNLYNDTHPSAAPDILLTVLASTDDGNFGSFGSFTGGGSGSGTWNLPAFLVDFVAVKASSQFVLYQLDSPASSGFWDTFDIPFQNNPHDISHLVFFGTEQMAAVPEPATWAFMIFGFGAIGGALRRQRSVKTTISYA